MIEIPASDGGVELFELSPDQRATRRGAAPALTPKTGFIEITNPLVTPVTEKLVANDAELAAFWEAEKRTYRYDYVSFRFTLNPAAGEPFEKAWVELRLEPLQDGGPIVYSMAPDQVVDITKISESAKIGTEFKFIKAEMGAKVDADVKDYVLRAWREHTAEPYWTFGKTKSTELMGTFRLHLITRTPAKLSATGRISARAVVQKRTFLIIRKGKPMDGPASLTFALSG